MSSEKGWEVREETMLQCPFSHESGDRVLVALPF